MSQHDALIDACRKRVQPIVMTPLAMGAGMMPNALGFPGDSSFLAPMAIAVIGGLITSTLLSLMVIPAAFTVASSRRGACATARRIRLPVERGGPGGPCLRNPVQAGAPRRCPIPAARPARSRWLWQ
ncbi:efflux RND transporter permease subunit [Xanthomonas cerealis]|uniref:efflux RND transporter permease subunit n=1 Tax=Xanthomonas cerealis TaxID=3390025 RepID=UPI001C400BE3|nr:efflux RND transporter permease subunit [Xanthomonas translucens]